MFRNRMSQQKDLSRNADIIQDTVHSIERLQVWIEPKPKRQENPQPSNNFSLNELDYVFWMHGSEGCANKIVSRSSRIVP
jgi:hypothetical protein